VLEGIFFYCGFTQILSMGRRNKMTGVPSSSSTSCVTSPCT
jgi:ribonucleotide reductase beta subunit family protein with ferritin-like domain